MTEKNQLYKCNVCGNIVDVRHEGAGELTCCNAPMILLVAGVEDAAVEKHIPVVELKDGKITVQVGEVEHPMDEDHYIEWITLITKSETKTVYLAPGDEPQTIFDSVEKVGMVYAYCNLHGLWKIEL